MELEGQLRETERSQNALSERYIEKETMTMAELTKLRKEFETVRKHTSMLDGGQIAMPCASPPRPRPPMPCGVRACGGSSRRATEDDVGAKRRSCERVPAVCQVSFERNTLREEQAELNTKYSEVLAVQDRRKHVEARVWRCVGLRWGVRMQA